MQHQTVGLCFLAQLQLPLSYASFSVHIGSRQQYCCQSEMLAGFIFFVEGKYMGKSIGACARDHIQR